MVYCGKPSRGCQMCRTRRIKCDETKPTCNQCAKSRRQCPGYKDEFDLILRNETQATERRARKASKKAPVPRTDKSPSAGSGEGTMMMSLLFTNNNSSNNNTAKQPIPAAHHHAVIRPLNVSVEHQASCHFISHFILTPRDGSGRALMDYMLPLLKDSPQAHLQHAFNACAMAFFNNRGGVCSRFSDQALHEYTRALNGTNTALRNPETQLADTTLAAVLLLGLFESITAKQIGMMNWGSHTEGAIQLVKARGKKQLKTKIGLALFIAVRTQMIIHSLTSGTAPIMGPEWWIDDANRNDTATRCHRIMIKLGELRAEVMRLMNSMAKTPENVEIMHDMLRRIQTVDQEVVAWMRNVPDEWRFRTVAWEDHVPDGDYSKAEVFPGRVDMYRDLYIVSVWNTSRTARLVLASLVVRCAAWICSPVDYRTTPEYATAARTCVDTITDVIASVPYQLGWHLNKDRRRQHIFLHQQQQELLVQQHQQLYQQEQEQMQQQQQSGFPCGEEDHPKAIAGYLLTWPLICVHSQDYTTDTQRAWIHGRLKHIGDELGVKYAHVLRQLQIRMPSMLIRRDALMAKQASSMHEYLRRQHQQQQQQVRSGNGQAQSSMAIRIKTPLTTTTTTTFAPPVPPGMSAGVYVGQAALDGGGVNSGVGISVGGIDGGSSALQHIQALQKERFEQHRAELLARAAGGRDAGESQKWVAQGWLVV
ncbi:uncharacterized protein F4812DRAFT_243289 [Daldinia caldariorum]|uniref:uncharacterized protein n=1 Tax=Daldinia caldariorum TaxID=326644 RepID=UPI002007D84E|nr:uncharacterized protein F4812DRAFT_243289 [Daldinia caldariorum]KAI1463546.1 hypothetical protein F4812DRAFT_243289 [Daldinia caldariorum]